MNSPVHRDVSEVIHANPRLADSLKDKSFFITGSTGMVGRYVVSLLAENTKINSGSGTIVAHARNKEKAEQMFGDYLGMENFSLMIGDISDVTEPDVDIDYVIHSASPTQPQDFLERPVDIITANVFATKRLLDIARAKSARFCLLSTLEVYGKIEAPSYPVEVSEEDFGALNSLDLRSAYPESKRLAENLCVAYLRQFGVLSAIVRLAPTISPIIDPQDERVFAQFVNKVARSEDIQIFSDAAQKMRSYTYITDAVTGILTAVTNATEDNYVFNLANNDNVASIKTLAETVIAHGSGGSSLRIIERESDENTSPTTGLVVLSSQKLINLGWKPSYSLDESVSRIVSVAQER